MLGVVGLVGMRHVVRSPVDFVRIQPTRPTAKQNKNTTIDHGEA